MFLGTTKFWGGTKWGKLSPMFPVATGSSHRQHINPIFQASDDWNKPAQRGTGRSC